MTTMTEREVARQVARILAPAVATTKQAKAKR
jgi:hypothetical protein